MLQAGLTVSEVVATLTVVSAILGGIGVLGWYVGVPDSVMLFGLLVPVGAHTWFEQSGRNHIPQAWRLADKKKSSFKTPQPLLK
jgi:hypothetical protein